MPKMHQLPTPIRFRRKVSFTMFAAIFTMMLALLPVLIPAIISAFHALAAIRRRPASA
jgi:hypothetical protein